MSRETLEKLRDATAFKPKPPDFELAIAHVHVADVGIPHAIDARVLNAMITDDEAFTIVMGSPGSGKSSLLTAAARAAGRREGSPVALPLKVPVAHHTEPLTANLLVKAIAQSLAYELSGQLTATDRKKLDKALATTIVRGRQSGGLSGSLSAGLPGLTAGISAAIGKDLVTLTSNADWQAGGPVQALLTLRDLAAAHDTRLVVIFDDTDVWSVGDEEMATRAGRFFSALRFLLECPEVSILVAVQTHWAETGATTEAATRTARREYRELAERVGARLHVPLPQSKTQARKLMAAVIDRRVEIALPSETRPRGGWSETLFTAEALDLLANRCFTKTIRLAIGDIRDAFDHLDGMPDQMDREHLVEVIDD
jgi:energy-coupling factor transporter ATP-binding protein EcfA2